MPEQFITFLHFLGWLTLLCLILTLGWVALVEFSRWRNRR